MTHNIIGIADRVCPYDCFTIRVANGLPPGYTFCISFYDSFSLTHHHKNPLIKAILWDNDGVLVDTERLYYRATRKILLSVGVDLTPEMYSELFLVQAKGAWHLAEAKGLSPGEVTRLRSKRNDLYLELLQTEATAIDGVEEVLKALHKKYLMGIVTSSHREHFEAMHRKTGFLQYFSFALTAGDYEHYKPHPQPYLTALGRTGYEADRCIAVEDSKRGLVSATKAGLKCIVIPTDMTRGETFEGAYRIVSSIREIPPLLSAISLPQNT